MLDDEATRKALDYAITISHALQVQTKNITEAMIAADVLVRVLGERFPELAEKYEKYRAEAAKDSPLSIATASRYS